MSERETRSFQLEVGTRTATHPACRPHIHTVPQEQTTEQLQTYTLSLLRECPAIPRAVCACMCVSLSVSGSRSLPHPAYLRRASVRQRSLRLLLLPRESEGGRRVKERDSRIPEALCSPTRSLLLTCSFPLNCLSLSPVLDLTQCPFTDFVYAFF